jgi:hypothetical protein
MTCCRSGGKQFDVLRSAYLRQKRGSLQKARFNGIIEALETDNKLGLNGLISGPPGVT